MLRKRNNLKLRENSQKLKKCDHKIKSLIEMIAYKVEKTFQNIKEKENKMECMKKKFTDQFQSPGIYFLGVQYREQ